MAFWMIILVLVISLAWFAALSFLTARWFEKKEGKQCRYTLLVVEDSLEMRLFVTKQLSSEYQVLTAVNGIEALKVLGEHPIFIPT